MSGTIRFGARAVDTNGAAAAGSIDAGNGPNEIDAAWLRAEAPPKFRQLLALVDADEDPSTGAFGDGADRAFNLSDLGSNDRVTSLAANGTDADPVRITAHGRLDNRLLGDLTGAVRFSASSGFGLDSGPDGTSSARFLNRGDALDFAVTGGQTLARATFTALFPGASPANRLVLDVDGATAADSNGAAAGGFVTAGLVEIGGLSSAAALVVDFVARTITVDGVAATVTGGSLAAFFAAAAASGSDNITIGSRHDAVDGFSMRQLALTSAPPPDAPVTAQDDGYAAAESTALVVSAAAGLLANDAAPDGGPIAIAGTIPTAAGGLLVLAADGAFTYTPAQGFLGTDTAIYTVRDADGDLATATVTFTVVGVDDPVVAAADVFSAVEDVPLVVGAAAGLLANDAAADGGLAAAAGRLATARGGEVLIAADGSFTYRPPADAFGLDSFEYAAVDANGSVATAVATIDVVAADDPVVAADDALAAIEDTILTGAAGALLGNDRAADGGLAAVAETVTTTAGGTLVVSADGGFTYTAASGFSGTDRATYRATDADGDTAAATVTFEVAAVDDPLVAADDEYQATEDATLTIAAALGLLANDSAGDGGLAAVAGAYTTTLGGTLTIAADGAFTYAPPADVAAATDSVDYAVLDADGDMAVATVRFAVAAADDGVAAAADAYAVDNGAPTMVAAAFGLLANDTGPDGGLAAVAGIVATAGGGTLAIAADGGFTYTANGAFVGEDSATYTLVDQDGSTATGTVAFSVADGDSPVIALGEAYALVRLGNVLRVNDAARGLLANDTGLDGGLQVELEFGRIYRTEFGREIDIRADGTFELFASPAEGAGIDSFIYTVVDADGSRATATATFDVGPGDTVPRAFDDTYTISAGATLRVDAAGGLLANDIAENGGKRVLFAGPPSRGTLTVAADGSFVYVAPTNFIGIASPFVYAMEDAQGDQDFAFINFVITDAVVIAEDDRYAATEDTTLRVTDPALGLLANDALGLGARAIAKFVGDPAGSFFEVFADGTFAYRPPADFAGTQSISYAIRDLDGTVSAAFVTFEIANTPDIVARTDNYVVPNGRILFVPAGRGVLANDSSPDGGLVVTQEILQLDDGSLLLIGTGGLLYLLPPRDPALVFASGVYRVTDAAGDSVLGRVNLLGLPTLAFTVGEEAFLPFEFRPGYSLDIFQAGLPAAVVDIEVTGLIQNRSDGLRDTFARDSFGEFRYVPVGRETLQRGETATTTVTFDALVAAGPNGALERFAWQATVTIVGSDDPTTAVADNYSAANAQIGQTFRIPIAALQANDLDRDGVLPPFLLADPFFTQVTFGAGPTGPRTAGGATLTVDGTDVMVTFGTDYAWPRGVPRTDSFTYYYADQFDNPFTGLPESVARSATVTFNVDAPSAMDLGVIDNNSVRFFSAETFSVFLPPGAVIVDMRLLSGAGEVRPDATGAVTGSTRWAYDPRIAFGSITGPVSVLLEATIAAPGVAPFTLLAEVDVVQGGSFGPLRTTAYNGGDGATPRFAGGNGVFATFGTALTTRLTALDGQDAPDGRPGMALPTRIIIEGEERSERLIGNAASNGGDGGNGTRGGNGANGDFNVEFFGAFTPVNGGRGGAGGDGGAGETALEEVFGRGGSDVLVGQAGGDAGTRGQDSTAGVAGQSAVQGGRVAFGGAAGVAGLGGAGGDSIYRLFGGTGADLFITGSLGRSEAVRYSGPGAVDALINAADLPSRGQSIYLLAGEDGDDEFRIAPANAPSAPTGLLDLGPPPTPNVFEFRDLTTVAQARALRGEAGWSDNFGSYRAEGGAGDDLFRMADDGFYGLRVDGGTGFDSVVAAERPGRLSLQRFEAADQVFAFQGERPDSHFMNRMDAFRNIEQIEVGSRGLVTDVVAVRHMTDAANTLYVTGEVGADLVLFNVIYAGREPDPDGLGTLPAAPFEGQFVAWHVGDLDQTPYGTLFTRYQATLLDGTVVATLWAEVGLDVAVF